MVTRARHNTDTHTHTHTHTHTYAHTRTLGQRFCNKGPRYAEVCSPYYNDEHTPFWCLTRSAHSFGGLEFFTGPHVRNFEKGALEKCICKKMSEFVNLTFKFAAKLRQSCTPFDGRSYDVRNEIPAILRIRRAICHKCTQVPPCERSLLRISDHDRPPFFLRRFRNRPAFFAHKSITGTNGITNRRRTTV